eukprot:126922-Rhodomonas_salina.1
MMMMMMMTTTRVMTTGMMAGAGSNWGHNLYSNPLRHSQPGTPAPRVASLHACWHWQAASSRPERHGSVASH